MPSLNATISAPATERTRSRKFGVSDSMVLIGGIALVLTFSTKDILNLSQQFYYLCRTITAYFGLASFGPPQFLTKHMAIYSSCVLWYGIQVTEWLLLIMTPVFLLMRLRPPRPPLRELLGQPGTVAGLSVAFGLIWVTGWLHRLFYGRTHPGTVTAIAIGGTAAVAWSVLALGRNWNAERSWIDRMGRLIGATAIAVGLFVFLRYGS